MIIFSTKSSQNCHKSLYSKVKYITILLQFKKGRCNMKTVTVGFTKLVLSYLTVAFVLMFMPVFLITHDFSAFDSIINYLFNNENAYD